MKREREGKERDLSDYVWNSILKTKYANIFFPYFGVLILIYTHKYIQLNCRE